MLGNVIYPDNYPWLWVVLFLKQLILQTFPNNKLFLAAFIFFLFDVILKISLTIVLLYFLNKTKNWFLIVLGSHHITQLVETDTKSKNKQRRCKVCTKKTCCKCGKCSKPGQPSVLCKEGLRACFARFHDERIYDLQSSNSQQSCNSPE